MTTTTTTTMSLQCHDITRRPDLVSVFDRFNGYCRTKAAKQSELIQPKSMKLQGDGTLLQFLNEKLSHGNPKTVAWMGNCNNAKSTLSRQYQIRGCLNIIYYR